MEGSSHTWKDLDFWTITSSNFGKVLHRKTPSKNLLEFLFNGPNIDKVLAIMHGRVQEGSAVKTYVASKSEQGSPVSVRACGIVLQPTFRFLVASPDRVVYDASAGPQHGLLEVKCPYSPFIAGQTVTEAACARPDFC